MSHAAEEIASQPECWRHAIELAPTVAPALPARAARVAAIGCGTSHNIAKVYAALRERLGHGETDAFASSEALLERRYDHLVFFSRTGTTSETLAALRAAPAGTPTTALTATLDSPLAREAERVVPLDFADEVAVIQTRFFTTAVTLLRVHLGDDVDRLLDDGEWALTAALPDGAAEARQHTFLGRGWAAALADEATLKMRETAQVWAEGHQAMEYRHGPISLAERGVLVWCFGTPPEGIADEVRATGASWEHHDLDALADLVRVQRLAVQLAEARGLDPDHPKHLSYSVVLSDAVLGAGAAARR